jgi:hypothetical protein
MAFMRNPLYILMQDGKVDIYFRDGIVPFTQELFDEIVMMRYYNMTEEERRATINRVLETQLETGADGIRKASGLSTVMERVHENVSWPPNSGGLETIDKY